MSRAVVGTGLLTAAAGCAAYAQVGMQRSSGRDGGGDAAGGRSRGGAGGAPAPAQRVGSLMLDEVHVSYLDAMGSARGHRGVALAAVIDDAGARAADAGGADEVFNTPRCAVRSSPGAPKGKKKKVRSFLHARLTNAMPTPARHRAGALDM